MVTPEMLALGDRLLYLIELRQLGCILFLVNVKEWVKPSYRIMSPVSLLNRENMWHV